MKLFDSEWKVMEVLWQENDRTAKEISLRLSDSIGCNKNTTYTAVSYTHLDVYKRQGYTYAGFPAQSGSGSAYQVLSSLGLGQQCGDPDGAKAFFEFCFSYSQDLSLIHI